MTEQHIRELLCIHLIRMLQVGLQYEIEYDNELYNLIIQEGQMERVQEETKFAVMINDHWFAIDMKPLSKSPGYDYDIPET